MSRAGFPSGNLSSPQTHETMQGNRRDSPVLQTGTGRSGPNSPTNQGNIPPPMNIKDTLPGNVHKNLDRNMFWRVFSTLLPRFFQ